MKICSFHYPEHRSVDPVLINRFIKAFPLALIVSKCNDQYFSSYIPLLCRGGNLLFGHADRRNLQFSQQSLVAQVFFIGPNSYIPPEGYCARQLPTWSYLAVHMQARIDVIQDDQQVLDILRQSADAFSGRESVFCADPEDSRVMKNLENIVAFQVVPSQVEARFKLSQDKSPVDRQSALNWFLNRDLEPHRELFQDLLHHRST